MHEYRGGASGFVGGHAVNAPKQFWLVWNPKGGNPSFQHHQQGSATIEAERLARENRGSQFFVVHVVSMSYVEPSPSITKILEIPSTFDPFDSLPDHGGDDA
jgi:hypothetical protein